MVASSLEPAIFSHVANAEGAQLRACMHGLLLFAKEKVILKTDCCGVVAKLANGDRDRSLYGSMIEDIKYLLQGFSDTVVRSIRREANGVAHIMAKEGCDGRINRTWRAVPPSIVMDTLVKDLSVA
jgi:hypothetical protein